MPVGGKYKPKQTKEPSNEGDGANSEFQTPVEREIVLPKPYVQHSIYKVFVWANNKSLKSILNEVVLKAGAYIVSYSDTADTLHSKKFEETLSTIMGYIEASNFVLLGMNEDTLSVLEHDCKACCMTSCSTKGESCAIPVEVFIFRYAQEKGKAVLPFFISSERSDPPFDLSGLKKEMWALEGYCELSIGNLDVARVEGEYRRFASSWEQRHPKELCILSTMAASEDGGKDRLLRVLSACTQEKGEPRTIGLYTIESGEMVDADCGDEIHIITNEIYNYDFTPMSSLTIAINTQKGVHYYYYVPADQIEAVKLLKLRIADYYRQRFRVKRGIVSWIRHAKSQLFKYEEFLSSLKNLSIRHIIERLLGEGGFDLDTEVLDDMCNIICQAAQIANRDSLAFRDINVPRIVKWISGWNDNNDKIRSSIYMDIDKLCVLLMPFYGRYREHRETSSAIKSFCEKLELIKHMKMLTVWHAEDPNDDKVKVGERPSAGEIEEILSTTFSTYQSSKKEVNIPLPMYEWLKPQYDREGKPIELTGELPVEESDIADWLENIHCCPIADEQPYTLCYNFSLFLCHGGSDDADAAWYETWEKNAPAKPNDELVDNDLMMIGFKSDSSVYREIKECYKHIVLANPMAYEEIKKSKSKLLQVLNISSDDD